MGLSRRVVVALLIALASFAAAGAAFAQRGFRGSFREGGFPYIAAPEQMPDASFVICRLAYRRVRAEESGIGWQTDYPYAEINLTTRLSELTKTRVSRNESAEPRHYAVQPLDNALFNCPILVASDAGTLGFTDAEAARLREYFLKGGFLWADDFWGNAAWDSFSREIAKVLPPSEFPLEEIEISDPMLHSQFELSKVPQITNIQFWRRSGGRETSERGEESRNVNMRVIRDVHRRIMVVATHNTDVADSWEREGEDPEFFYQFSPDGYALGIDVMLYAMTH
jgi:Domain of unknown function (DUF4159)